MPIAGQARLAGTIDGICLNFCASRNRFWLLVPGRIAEVALWLTDHQANIALSQAFGQFYDRLPLRASPHIHVRNALRMDWKQVIPPGVCSYILGNPPFVGKHYQNAEQHADMAGALRQRSQP